MRKTFLTLVFLLCACAAPPVVSGAGYSLRPYATSTPSVAAPPNVIVILETPQPTSTPLVYQIQSGDTFSALAERFKISQDELRAANPNILPNSMPVGEMLTIPDVNAPRAALFTPTALPVPVTQLTCHPAEDSGLWCFVLVQNITGAPLENVSALVTLLDEAGNPMAAQTAFTPLDVIPANQSLPASAYFANVPSGAVPRAQLLSAVPLTLENGRYLPAQIQNSQAQISWSGKNARVSGAVFLPAESKAATQVWIAAIAYDEEHQVVGLKRWQGGGLQSGGLLPFEFFVYSLAREIHTVEFAVQAR